MTEHIIYTNEQLANDIDMIVHHLAEERFEPDLIVGILRGGAIPAIHLSHKLNCPVEIVEWSTRDSNKRDVHALNRISAATSYGKKILIVDDIVDSGKTLKEIKEQMSNGEENTLYTSLWYNFAQDATVDYWCRGIDRAVDDRWIVFPWEK